jgi:hypothetical protein
VESREKRRLTLPPEGNLGDFFGAFSPDGRTVAFVRSTAAQTGDLYILPVAADLTARAVPRRLTNDNGVDAGVAWTADGGRLVFSSNRGGSPALWRIAVSGSNGPERLTVGENGILPSIPRQGNRLVYSLSVVDSNIWRVNLSDPRESPAPFIASTATTTIPNIQPTAKHRLRIEPLWKQRSLGMRCGRLQPSTIGGDGPFREPAMVTGRSVDRLRFQCGRALADLPGKRARWASASHDQERVQ